MSLLPLLAAWAWGASTVQLSLPLAPSAATALAPAMPTVSRFETIEAISAIPAEVERALKSGDADAFHEAALASGYAPPEGDDHQQRLLEEGASRARAEEAFAELLESRAKAEAFEALLRRFHGLSSSVFEHTAAKRDILKSVFGYTHLNGKGGARVPIEAASAKRVGEVFRKALKAYQRRAQ